MHLGARQDKTRLLRTNAICIDTGRMPRIPPSIFRAAVAESRYLPWLLPVTRSLQGARSELRWIKQCLPHETWRNAVLQRGVLCKPLQYILGDQPFGDLQIKCNPNALIPRWETEEWVLKIINAVKSRSKPLKVVDYCTGTGCIALQFAYSFPKSSIVAVDIDEKCLQLAADNLKLNSINNVTFIKHDIFDLDNFSTSSAIEGVNFLVSNPPYIPLQEYAKLDKSVRNYEPQKALVGDLEFYEALINNVLIPNIGTCEAFVFEVGNQDQIDFIAALVSALNNWKVGYLKDSNGNVRCALGWKTTGNYIHLDSLCEFIY